MSNKETDDGVNLFRYKRRDLDGGLDDRYCPKFFTQLEVTQNGDCYMCCPSWVPHPIGNILTDNIHDIWNSEMAQNIRRQVFIGRWDYCVHALCPLIQSNTLPKIENAKYDFNHGMKSDQVDALNSHRTELKTLPTVIHLSEDRSCNLRCPSCRLEKIMHNPGSKEYELAKSINDRVYDIFFSSYTTRFFQLNLTGSGDAFASRIYRDFLRRLDGSMYPNLSINLMTNGVMFTPKMWRSIEHIHEQLNRCRISFDAGTKDTYENKTRLGGHWDLLVENCRYLNERSVEFPNFKLNYDFVVQQCNYHEMEQFAEFCLENFNNLEKISFSNLHDWQTWNREEYLRRAVWLPEHPEYEKLKEMIQRPIFKDPRINLGNLSGI